MAKGKDSDCAYPILMGDPRGEEMWYQGYCAEYALALAKKHPHLKLGFGASEDLGADWDPWSGEPAPFEAINHVFAHDDQYAYDALGRHPLPYFAQWDAGYQPQAEHNYLHYTEEDLVLVLSENWSARESQTGGWQPDRDAAQTASAILPENLQ